MSNQLEAKEVQGPFREITIRSGNTEAKVAPERGGIVTSFTVDGKEILYLDRATFDDSTKNVRGGIPVLFPNAGPLEGGDYDNLPQHGFARRSSWKLTTQDEESVTMTLDADEQTRKNYPFDFKLELNVKVDPTGKLIHTMKITNNGTEPMPTAYGTHPYLAYPDSSKPTLQTNISGLNPTEIDWSEEFDRPFANPGQVNIQVPNDDNNSPREVSVISNPTDFQTFYVWSLPGKNFVCGEPWTRPNNALNNPNQALMIQPGESVSLPITISAKSA